MKTQAETFKEHLKSENQLVKPVGDFEKKKIGYVEVEYGLTDVADYAWHFSSYHRAKPFPRDKVMPVRIIKTYLEKVIPPDVAVDVMFSPPNWDISVITILARGVGKKWNFDEELYEKPIEKICNLLTDEINKVNPRRTSL